MNSFLYKAEELWLNRRMPGINDPYYKDKMKVFNSRLHYPVSPELAAILTEGQEVKENEFALKNTYYERVESSGSSEDVSGGFHTTAIPLPEQTKQVESVQEQRLKTDCNVFIDRAIELMKETVVSRPVEFNSVAAYNGVLSLLQYAKESHKRQTKQEAGKQSAEQAAKEYLTKITLSSSSVDKKRDRELYKGFIAGAKWQSTQPAAATPVDDAELSPCPFCGHEAEIKQTGRMKLKIKCKSCVIGYEQKTVRHDLDWLRGKMIETWNKRISTHVSSNAGNEAIEFAEWKDKNLKGLIRRGQLLTNAELYKLFSGNEAERKFSLAEIEKLCREAYTDARTNYHNVMVQDWWPEFKLHNNLQPERK